MGKHKLIRLTKAQTSGKPPPSPLYYTLCLATRLTPKCHFVVGLPNGSIEIPEAGTFVILGPHNFLQKPLIEMKFEAKL
jgi:hypothetical protein